MLHVRCVEVVRRTADFRVLNSFTYSYKCPRVSLEPLEAKNLLNEAAVHCTILHVD